MSAAVPPISALRPIEPGLPHGGGREAALGELLRLRIEQGADGALIGRDSRGLQLRLPAGLAAIGEVLLLRVLATQPKLELSLVERQRGAPTVASEPTDDTTALRADQAWLQRLQVRSTGPALPASVALQWRRQVLAEVLRIGPALRPGDTAPAAGAEQGLALQMAPLPVLGWNAQALLLRLIVAGPGCWPSDVDSADDAVDADAEGQQQPASEGLSLALSLSLDGEAVQLLLQWRQGLLLQLAAEKAATLQRLRALLPQIAAALATVPLLLRHCQFSSRPLTSGSAAPEQQAHGLAQGSSGLLFRAAAEIVRVLQQHA